MSYVSSSCTSVRQEDPNQSGYTCVLHRPKLCQIIRDDMQVDVEELGETFRRLGFSVSVHNLPDGRAADRLRDFLRQLATRPEGDAGGKFGCLLLAFVGGIASEGRLTVNGKPYPFLAMVDPFRNSAYLTGKPKLFFCQISRDIGPSAPDARQPAVDAAPFWATPAETAAANADVSVVIGGPPLVGCLNQVLAAAAEGGTLDEFKTLVDRLRHVMQAEAGSGISLDPYWWHNYSGLRFPLYLRAEV